MKGHPPKPRWSVVLPGPHARPGTLAVWGFLAMVAIGRLASQRKVADTSAPDLFGESRHSLQDQAGIKSGSSASATNRFAALKDPFGLKAGDVQFDPLAKDLEHLPAEVSQSLQAGTRAAQRGKPKGVWTLSLWGDASETSATLEDVVGGEDGARTGESAGDGSEREDARRADTAEAATMSGDLDMQPLRQADTFNRGHTAEDWAKRQNTLRPDPTAATAAGLGSGGGLRWGHAAEFGTAGSGNAGLANAAGGPTSMHGFAAAKGSNGAASSVGAATTVEKRVSGLGPKLDAATLQGGWQLTQAVYDRLLAHPNVTVLSKDAPRVLHFRELLTAEEAEHLIELAWGQFERSEVVADTGKIIKTRTSYGAWLNGEKRDAKVLQIQHRIHRLLGIPEEFGESLHVLQYNRGQKYAAHDDHCWGHRNEPLSDSCRAFLKRAGGPTCGPGAGGATCGDRMLTVVMYLHSPKYGGATAFPYARPAGSKAKGSTLGRHGQSEGRGSIRINSIDVPWFCQEGADALQVSAKPGDAAIFWNYVPGVDGGLASPDETAAHAGCPVLDGAKFIATRWVRSAEFL